MYQMNKPIRVFCSYVEKDVSFLQLFEQHLSVLQHEHVISMWHRRRITAGQDWQLQQDQHLDEAQLICLFISPDFLASDYKYGVELRRAMQLNDSRQAQVMPIIIRPCDWSGTIFAHLEVFPHNGEAIVLWSNQDEVFAQLAREIRALVEGKKVKPSSYKSSANTPYHAPTKQIFEVSQNPSNKPDFWRWGLAIFMFLITVPLSTLVFGVFTTLIVWLVTTYLFHSQISEALTFIIGFSIAALFSVFFCFDMARKVLRGEPVN